MPVGTSGPRCNGMKWSTFGQAEDKLGVAFLVLIYERDFRERTQLTDLFPREGSHFFGDQKRFDPTSFSYVTREFLCKIVISFGVFLFVLKCSSLLHC